MKTVNEVSKLTGISVRTLHHYDSIGLLRPTATTDAGYRLYDDNALERLQHILLFRELEFPLKEIKEILDSPDFNRNRALDQQIEMLTLKKEHLQNLIDFATGVKAMGIKYLDFSAFDSTKLDECARMAKLSWGKTDAYKEYEEKTKDLTDSEITLISQELLTICGEFGNLKHLSPSDKKVQEQVKKLQDYITTNFYTCTTEILALLGKMYSGGGSLTENINSVGGEGAAEFAGEAIRIYCASAKTE